VKKKVIYCMCRETPETLKTLKSRDFWHIFLSQNLEKATLSLNFIQRLFEIQYSLFIQ